MPHATLVNKIIKFCPFATSEISHLEPMIEYKIVHISKNAHNSTRTTDAKSIR